MTIQTTPQIDWTDWMRRWDVQQSYYLPGREDRFDAMLDVLAAALPEDFLALDLASGPGSISQRLLQRFPRARVIALDLDPVLLALGRNVLGTADGRLRWVEASLLDEQWPAQLGEEQVDAVLSTTALHWLPSEHLLRVYQQLGALVRPGGIVLNGDHLAFAPDMPTFQQIANTVKERRHAASGERGQESWDAWWTAVRAEPALTDLVAERDRRFSWRIPRYQDSAPIFALHDAALRDAGFREVGVIWQNMDNRVLMAVR